MISARTNWIALKTITRKEVVRFIRIWQQTLLPPAINQTLYFVIFGSFIGSQVADIDGVSYMAFLVPGLIMMAVINAAFSNVSSSFFGSKFQRNIDELLVSPSSNWVIIGGYVAGGVLRALLVAVIIFVISMLFVAPSVQSPLIVLAFVLLTALLFSLAGLTAGIFSRRFDDVAIVPTFVLTPLTYFGGVFYSIQSLPEFWQGVSKANPILYMIDGFRYGFYGNSDISVWTSAAILLAMLLTLAVLNAVLIRRGTGLRS